MQAPQGSSADDLQLARSYDSTAAEYDRVAVPNIFTPPAEDLVALMELPAGGLVLDVGGGSGAVSVPAAKAVGPTGLVDARSCRGNASYGPQEGAVVDGGWRRAVPALCHGPVRRRYCEFCALSF